jgi:hypothetical protein
MCAGGVLVDNATKCGCPSGKRISANGLACEPIPCNDSGVSVPEGTCSPKTSGKMCIGGVLVDKASQCPCKSGLQREGEICVTVCSDGTKAGECSAAKPKECTLSGTGVGVLVDNAAKCGCPTGKTAVGKQCIETGLGSIGGAEVLGAGGQPANESQAAGGAGPLSCCCLPAALISLAGGFAFFGKRGQ